MRTQDKNEAVAEIRPELSAYFGSTKVSAPAFLKAVRAAKTKRFTPDDEARASALMSVHDADGDRLWALMSQPALPAPIERWVWKAVVERLKGMAGEGFDPFAASPAEILGRIKGAVRDLPSPEDRAKKGETWLRIAACWLMERRSMDPWQVAEQALGVLFATPTEAATFAARAIQRGRASDFRIAVATAGLVQATVDGALKERDAERKSAVAVQGQLVDARAEIDTLKDHLGAARRELSATAEALKQATARLEAERQHFGHDLSGERAERRVLLRQRVAPLLSDAVDALEIEPPAPGIALERLKTVLSLIDEASRD